MDDGCSYFRARVNPNQPFRFIDVLHKQQRQGSQLTMDPSSPSRDRTPVADHPTFHEENEEMKPEQAPSIVLEDDPEKNDNKNGDDNLEPARAMTAQKSVRFKGIIHCFVFCRQFTA